MLTDRRQWLQVFEYTRRSCCERMMRSSRKRIKFENYDYIVEFQVRLSRSAFNRKEKCAGGGWPPMLTDRRQWLQIFEYTRRSCCERVMRSSRKRIKFGNCDYNVEFEVRLSRSVFNRKEEATGWSLDGEGFQGIRLSNN